MDFQLMSIRTPRADSAKILKENAGETGSGPKFAGDEDKFFLEGIEEVLAQWEPEVGEMPPVDPRSLNLPHHPKPIIALSRKEANTDEVMEDAGPDSGKSTGTPSFRPAKDTVFLDGLEEVVPNPEEEEEEVAQGREVSEAPVPLPSVAPSVDVLTPLEVHAVALTVGEIRTPTQRNHEEYVRAEGPEFDAVEDAMFLDGVEEVVAEWEGGPPGGGLVSHEVDTSVDDGYFFDGLEETQGMVGEGSGDMHHAVDLRALSMEEERPASIRTSTTTTDAVEGGVGETREPGWNADDDGHFLDTAAFVEEAVHSAVSNSGGGCAGGRGVNLTEVLLKKHLRVKTPPRGEMATHVASSSTATPANTPTGEGSSNTTEGEVAATCGDSRGGAVGVEVPVGVDYAKPTTTPNNTPVDTDCTTTPNAAAVHRSASSLFRAIEGELSAGTGVSHRRLS